MPQSRTHVGSTREDTQTTITTPSTFHPNIIPTHRDTPNRSIRHSNAPPHTIKYSTHHALQHVDKTDPKNICLDGCELLQWKVNKRDELPNTKKNAATGRNSTERSHSKEFSSNALNFLPSPTKDPQN
ncbi:hypothetical protein TcCL_ESM11641 [Trypanosoma cruzi]|nr:hypothetical protein TcCL_ESM11641 [Trypanosoma cruzi]